MRIPILMLTVMVFAGTQDRGSTQLLDGCAKATTIADTITRLGDNWNDVSASRVISIWPTPLDELKCESEQPCRLLVSKDRVIAGHCECCESFQFDVERDTDGSVRDRLRSIIIHHSTRIQGQSVNTAKELARGFGMSDDKIAAIGRDSVQRFEWTKTKEGVTHNYLAEIRFTNANSLWHLFLSVSVSAN